jgi:hypothetical protein
MNKRDFSKLERSRWPCRPRSLLAAGEAIAASHMMCDPTAPEGSWRRSRFPETATPWCPDVDRPLALSASRAACASSRKSVRQPGADQRLRAQQEWKMKVKRTTRVSEGQPISVRLANALPQSTVVHSHGLVADGHRRSLGRDPARRRVPLRLRRAEPRGSAAERRGAGIRVRAHDGSLAKLGGKAGTALSQRTEPRMRGTSPGESTAVTSDIGPGHGREPAGASPDGATPPCVVTAAMAITAAKTMATTSQRVQRLLGREQQLGCMRSAAYCSSSMSLKSAASRPPKRTSSCKSNRLQFLEKSPTSAESASL